MQTLNTFESLFFWPSTFDLAFVVCANEIITMVNAEVRRQMTELRERAESIRSRFDDKARRPVVLEFAGMPKAGKTTIVTEIHRFLKRCGFRTKLIVEKASICPIRDKKDAAFNVWTSCQTLSELLADTQSPPIGLDPDIVIIDRGILDAVAWLRLLEKLKRLSAEDRQTIEKFMLLADWRKRISQVFVLTVDPEEALAREEGHLPIEVKGSIMNSEVLAQTRANLIDCVREFEGQFNVKKIDTTGKNTQTTAKAIAEQVLDVIDAHLEEKILSLASSQIETVFEGKKVLDPTGSEKLLAMFATSGLYQPRPEVEKNENRVQALPVLVVRNSKGDLLRLRRKEKDRKNPLHDRLVLWAGGHVREEDGQNGKAIMRCLLREAKEELKLNIAEREVHILGSIWERHATQKTSQHVALVFEWRAETEDVEVCLSNAEFYERRGTALSGKFIAADELVREPDMEPWSSAILQSLLTDTSKTSTGSLL